MTDLDGDPQSTRHSLSDWLALHALDPVTCRRLLDVMTGKEAEQPAALEMSNLAYEAPDPAGAFQRAAEAMGQLLPKRQSIIDDTFEKTVKIIVDQPGGSRKALTLDNGPAAYPTIFFSYRGEPSDFLVIAHEFAHALQIRASRGRFVPPIIREVCAFLGEGALLSHTQQCDAARQPYLVQVCRKNDHRYFGELRVRLQATLSQPGAPYRYSWNYPVARYLAVQMAGRFSPERIWSVFEGRSSVPEILRELAFSPDRENGDDRD